MKEWPANTTEASGVILSTTHQSTTTRIGNNNNKQPLEGRQQTPHLYIINSTLRRNKRTESLVTGNKRLKHTKVSCRLKTPTLESYQLELSSKGVGNLCMDKSRLSPLWSRLLSTLEPLIPLSEPQRFPAGSATRNFMEQINRSGAGAGFRSGPGNGYPEAETLTAQPRRDVSLLNSVEISSRVSSNSNWREQKELEEIVAMLGPDPSSASKERFDMTLECQESTVQFDLHKIASEFQVWFELCVTHH